MEGSSAAHRFHQPLSSHCSEVFFVITTAPRMVGGPGSSAEVVLMGRGIFNAVSDKVAVVVPGGACAITDRGQGDPVACAKALISELYRAGHIRPAL